MKDYNHLNLEKLIKFYLQQNNIEHFVKRFPYIMYSFRSENGSTRWSNGKYSNNLVYYVKYNSEYNKSCEYKDKFEKSNFTIYDFYNNMIYP